MKRCLSCGTINEDKVQECIICTGIIFEFIEETAPEPEPKVEVKRSHKK